MYARLLREIVVVIRGGWGLMDTKDAPPVEDEADWPRSGGGRDGAVRRFDATLSS